MFEAGASNYVKMRYFLFIFILFSFATCSDDELKDGQMPLGYNPVEFGEPVYNYEENELTQVGFELGRALFYDPILSKDSSISCSSCHQQAVAFAHADHDLSHGFDGLLGIRNATPIFNNRWLTSFFWDGGGNHIELVPLNAITNPVEMNEDLALALEKLNRSENYSNLFKNVFGITEIKSKNLFHALAQFTGAITSDDSKYDQVKRKETEFTASEDNGYSLFLTNCSTCHTEPLFTNNEFINNGLAINHFNDEGRKGITLDEEDLGKFRVPTLRNIAMTSPYMHDGKTATLEAVLEHYENGIEQSPTLATTLQNGIILTETEKSDLINFLHTLTDYTLLDDERFSNPR